MIQTLLVFLGGGIGAAGRHGVNIAAAQLFGTGFPAGTMLINVAGSFVMGLAAAWFAFRAGGELSQHARLFLTTGILGGFTTFSAFSLDAALLWERGETVWRRRSMSLVRLCFRSSACLPVLPSSGRSPNAIRHVKPSP